MKKSKTLSGLRSDDTLPVSKRKIQVHPFMVGSYGREGGSPEREGEPRLRSGGVFGISDWI